MSVIRGYLISKKRTLAFKAKQFGLKAKSIKKDFTKSSIHYKKKGNKIGRRTSQRIRRATKMFTQGKAVNNWF